jgi:hypothetical protein
MKACKINTRILLIIFSKEEGLAGRKQAGFGHFQSWIYELATPMHGYLFHLKAAYYLFVARKMERLALQRMLFPTTTTTAAAVGPRPKQQQGSKKKKNTTDFLRPRSSLSYTKQDDLGEVQRVARQWQWLTGLSVGQQLAAGAWFFV